jgi:hypothetical protein
VGGATIAFDQCQDKQRTEWITSRSLLMHRPIPTLDHVVVNVRDGMDAAEALYRRLGFTLTSRGFHTLGSVNHLAMFGTDYLELLGTGVRQDARAELLTTPLGLNSLVFGTNDAVATAAALAEAGVVTEPPRDFSRPVALAEGTRDAVFRTVNLPPGSVPAGRLYFCEHRTRDLVWRDEWRHHANGAVGIAGVMIGALRPEPFASLFGRMFGEDALHSIDGGIRLVVGLTSVDIVTPGRLAALYGAAAPKPAEGDYMAALSLRTRSLRASSGALRAGGIGDVREEGARILVPAAGALGVTLEFVT